MKKQLKKGNTLLAKGPTRITLEKGKVEVFGKVILAENKNSNDLKSEFNSENVIIIPSATSYPFYALENSELEIFTADENNVLIIKENTITDKWIEIKNSILEDIKKRKGKTPLKIMVIGISSGKTTLIKYLANNFLKEGLKGGYLDSDLGQQIIYLPTTLNIGTIESAIVTSEDINSEDTIFIGATFPKGNYKFIVSHYCRNLIDNYFDKHKDIDFLLIDTDGWIKTEAGIVYKNFFIKTVEPDILIIFHDETIEELKEIENTTKEVRKDIKIYLIKEKNKYFYEKDKEERRFLRQSQFARVLEDYRKITIPLNDIKFVKMDYDMEKDEIFEREINVEELIKLPYHYVIIALMTEDSQLIRIGLLFSINIEKDYILLFSNLSYKERIRVKKIMIGTLRLSMKGNHQGFLYL
ncbi:MAG: Clp1/GlmU family protein [Promethearchaeota archaeon]